MKAVDDTPVWSIVCTYVAKMLPWQGLPTQAARWGHRLCARAAAHGHSRRTRSTSQNAAMTTSCSSAHEVSTSAPVFAR